jgi:hypothetical protein
VPVDADALFALVDGLTHEAIRAKRDAVAAYRATIGWEFEEPQLLAVYRDLHVSGGSVAAAGTPSN